ncbi:MAG: hypothetical protein A2234_02240 [Elusimicrobia bacterium RIFOXYA2_FULL_58_8]|nr:MAG: hypothetical protein A2234_02240 [Elusimicrobia bacterium RIFOXYA2_FULL_58_8]
MGQDVTGIKTFTSSVTVTAAQGMGAARVGLSGNVSISSETSAALGGGVRISSNVYIVGYSSAARYYGDGSGLTNLPLLGDNLGTHLAAQKLDMGDFPIVRVASITITGQDASGYSLWLSSGINMAGGRVEAGVYSGSGELLTDLNAASLTSGTVPLARLSGITKAELDANADILDTQLHTIAAAGKVADTALSANVVLRDSTQTITGTKTFISSVTVTGLVGVPNVQLAGNVTVSSEALAMGGGVRVSSNVYIVGYSSAAKYYGDGSSLTGFGTFGTYIGMSATARDGNRGGYTLAHAECTAAFPGSHICASGEILYSVYIGVITTTFPIATLWINNGPPGHNANTNDCNGWTSAGASENGALWNKVAAGEGFGSIQPCNGTARKFACCK